MPVKMVSRWDTMRHTEYHAVVLEGAQGQRLDPPELVHSWWVASSPLGSSRHLCRRVTGFQNLPCHGGGLDWSKLSIRNVHVAGQLPTPMPHSDRGQVTR